MNIDHRDLLKKYIRYVSDVEGSDFIEDGYRGYSGDQKFTSEEWAELEKLAQPTEPPTAAG